jgi:hypothetical protein
MRHAIIASAAVVLIAGAGSYGWLAGSAPGPIGGTTTSAGETPKLEQARAFAAADDAPRIPMGRLIVITPPPEPEITTGSVNPTAKPDQAAKAVKAPKQARKPKATARKQVLPQQNPDSPTATPLVATVASPTGAVSGAE